MESKKKILFVTNVMGRAGAERTLIALLEKFDLTKYDVSLFAIMPRGEFFKEVPSGIRILNKKYSTESIIGSSSTFYKIRQVLKALFYKCYFIVHFPYLIKNLFSQLKMKRFSVEKLVWHALSRMAPLQKEKFDLAVAYIEGASTYYVADRVNASKKVGFVHIDYSKSGYVKKLDKPFYQKLDKIYCVSKTSKATIISAFPEFAEKTDTFQNTISDQYIIENADKGEGFTDGFDGIRLVTVGRLHFQKGYDIAIEAFAKFIKENDVKIRWYIIGEGPERPKLEKLITKYGVQDKFILLGVQQNPFPFVKQCDIYVHATRFEGWCIAIAEAKILKKPIIASNTAGVLEQLDNDSSIIINLTVDEIVAALKKLVFDAELRAKFTEILSEEWKRPNDIGKLYTLANGENS